MDERRKTQRKNAYIVGAVLLLLILLAILVYQIIAMPAKRSEYDELIDKVEYYKELKENGEDEIKIKETYEWIVERARELGYRFEDDKIIKPDE